MGEISKKDRGEIREFYGQKNFQSGKGVVKSGQTKKQGATAFLRNPLFSFGAPRRIRTSDIQIRSLILLISQSLTKCNKPLDK
jgi:hypothetical protein